MLRSSAAEHLETGDLALELPTGIGKTPAQRLAARRAVWGRAEIQPRLRRPVRPPDRREHNNLSTRPAHAALAAALLRHLHAVITTGQRWDPAIASGGRPDQTLNTARRPGTGGHLKPAAGASPTRHRDAPSAISPVILGSPANRRLSVFQAQFTDRMRALSWLWPHRCKPPAPMIHYQVGTI
jgi:hypothetical protein